MSDRRIEIGYYDYARAKEALERMKRKQLILRWICYLKLDTIEGNWFIYYHHIDELDCLVQEHIKKWMLMEGKRTKLIKGI